MTQDPTLDGDEQFLRDVIANEEQAQHDSTASRAQPIEESLKEGAQAQGDDTEPSQASASSKEAAEEVVAEPAKQTAETSESSKPAASSKTSCENLPEVSQVCIQYIIDASAKEERAMVFDRNGVYPGAVTLYREAAGILGEALHLMPEGHPDCEIIDTHIKEVHTRAAYLFSLGVNPADIPLEEHIHRRQLRIGNCAQGGKTTIAAGAVIGLTGLAFIGPMAGVALAAGAAYATTRQDKVGHVARAAGDAGLRAVENAKTLNEEHRWDDKLDKKLGISETVSTVDEKYQISDKVDQATATARSIDQKYSITENASAAFGQTKSMMKNMDDQYRITEKSKVAAAKTVQALSELNEKHQVTDKISYHANAAATQVSAWLRKSAGDVASAAGSKFQASGYKA